MLHALAYDHCFNNRNTETTMTSTGDVELRSVIKFCVGLKKTPAETLKLIQESSTLPSCGKTFVYKWHERFRNGRLSVNDDDRTGRPSTVITSKIDSVRDIIRKDRRSTVRTIADALDMSRTTVHQILTVELGMSKVSARWVPRLLSMEEKQRRVHCSNEFIQRYETEGDEFLDRIVTTDETWLYYYDPETKAQSSVWKTPRTPPPKKARVQRSLGKEMYIFFMDRQGMILQHRVPSGRTVNAEYYSKVCACQLYTLYSLY